MIQIQKGVSNTIVCTLTEKQTLSNPYFLFRFISEGGMNIERSVVLTDTATTDQKERFNKFTFTEGTDVTLEAGIWEYRVYEQTSPSNTDYNQSTSQVEIGLANVTGTDNVTFHQGSSNDTMVWTN